jgi:hypothetical protein
VIGPLACARRGDPGPPLAIELRVRPDPPAVGPARIEFDLHDAAGAPVRGALVRVEATMTHPGMAPEFFEAREQAPGTYAGAVRLTMAGDWVLLLEIHLADGRIARRRLDLAGVRSGR